MVNSYGFLCCLYERRDCNSQSLLPGYEPKKLLTVGLSVPSFKRTETLPGPGKMWGSHINETSSRQAGWKFRILGLISNVLVKTSNFLHSRSRLGLQKRELTIYCWFSHDVTKIP